MEKIEKNEVFGIEYDETMIDLCLQSYTQPMKTVDSKK